MAVYTKVDAQQVQAFLKNYDLGDYVSHEGITQGVENSNYHLFTSRGRFILTIFENRTDPAALPFVFSYMRHLSAAGLKVPDVIGDVGLIAGKKAAITQFLEGQTIDLENITPAHCAEMGAMLARMHKAAANFGMTRENPLSLDQWRALYHKIQNHIEPELAGFILETLNLCEDYRTLNIPRMACHADAFPDNVFFGADGKLSGVIDFYFSCTVSCVYDAAITVNAWCLDTKGSVIPDRLDAFVKAYESIRPFGMAERTAFPLRRRAAALRILMTRLYDWVNTPESASVTKKDPMEYVAKMKVECQWP